MENEQRRCCLASSWLTRTNWAGDSHRYSRGPAANCRRSQSAAQTFSPALHFGLSFLQKASCWGRRPASSSKPQLVAQLGRKLKRAPTSKGPPRAPFTRSKPPQLVAGGEHAASGAGPWKWRGGGGGRPISAPGGRRQLRAADEVVRA